jgi:alginate O-acetyltransferase complex protein AlgI
MNFTSYTYAWFLLGMLVAHWLAPRSARRPLLIAGSYVFYCSWQWRYGFLLFGLSLFNFYYARRTLWPEPRPRALAAGIAVNLAVLGGFKYGGFFAESIVDAGHLLHLPIYLAIPRIVAPLGISFFVFQGIAYLVDVATGDEPFERFLDFLLFKSFWPQLLAGPIVRPHEIRDQILTPRALAYEDLAVGGQRVLFGFAKKTVLADTVGPFVDMVFADHARPAAADVVVGTLAFGLQIYFDFSGYSDIAIGSARLFGYEFPENFDFPYSARSPQEFWQRWHQSLSRWIRDYVFGPLAFAARRNRAAGLAASVVAMALCGLWHGPRWTFVIWGVWHGALLVLGQTVLAPLWGPAAKGLRRWPMELAARASTLVAVGYGWLLFRATSLAHAVRLTRALFGGGLRPAVLRESAVLIIALITAGLFVVSMLAPAVRRLAGRPAPRRVWVTARPAVYCGMIALSIISQQDATAFVYFQF